MCAGQGDRNASPCWMKSIKPVLLFHSVYRSADRLIGERFSRSRNSNSAGMLPRMIAEMVMAKLSTAATTSSCAVVHGRPYAMKPFCFMCSAFASAIYHSSQHMHDKSISLNRNFENENH